MHHKVFKNASWIIGCKIVQSILNLFISMLSARYLGPGNFGLINYAASVVAFVVPIMQLGFRSTLVKEFVDNPDEHGEIVGTALLLNILSAIVCICGVVTFVWLINADETNTIIVCFLYSLNLIFQAFEMIQYWFQSKLISKYTSIVSLIAYVIVSVYKIFLLITSKGVYWFAVAQALDYFLIGFSLLVLFKIKSTNKLSVSFKRGKDMFNRSKFYIVSSMMVTIFQQTDKFMLKNMIDDVSVGYYSAAVVCSGMTSFVFAAIIDSMRPIILESKSNSDITYKNNVSLLYSIIFYLSLLQCIFMSLFAKPIVSIFYGAEYLPAADALRVSVWYVTYAYFGSVRNVWILAEGKQRYLWIINLIGAGLNVIMNFALIPILGINGASLASLITQFFTNFIFGFNFKPMRENNKLMIKGMNPKYAYYELKCFIKNFRKI